MFIKSNKTRLTVLVLLMITLMTFQPLNGSARPPKPPPANEVTLNMPASADTGESVAATVNIPFTFFLHGGAYIQRYQSGSWVYVRSFTPRTGINYVAVNVGNTAGTINFMVTAYLDANTYRDTDSMTVTLPVITLDIPSESEELATVIAEVNIPFSFSSSSVGYIRRYEEGVLIAVTNFIPTIGMNYVEFDTGEITGTFIYKVQLYLDLISYTDTDTMTIIALPPPVLSVKIDLPETYNIKYLQQDPTGTILISSDDLGPDYTFDDVWLEKSYYEDFHELEYSNPCMSLVNGETYEGTFDVYDDLGDVWFRLKVVEGGEIYYGTAKIEVGDYNVYALLVGIGDYQVDDYTDKLAVRLNDINYWYDHLTGLGVPGGSIDENGIPHGNIWRLGGVTDWIDNGWDAEGTDAHIEFMLNYIFLGDLFTDPLVTQGDRVYLVFDGHGGEVGGEAFFCPSDGYFGEFTLINYEFCNYVLKESELMSYMHRDSLIAEKVFIFFGSCSSGGFVDALEEMENNDEIIKGSVVCMTSCTVDGLGKTDYSDQYNEWFRSFFNAVNFYSNDLSVTLEELFIWARYTYGVPDNDPDNIPQMYYDPDTPFFWMK